MPLALLDRHAEAIRSGALVPVLGPGVLADVRDVKTGEALPIDPGPLSTALNNGRPMAPKLACEFTRAAMNVELKRGRSAVERFLTELHRPERWSTAQLHTKLAELAPPYLLDLNRDAGMQTLMRSTTSSYFLIRGLARMAGPAVRYELWRCEEGLCRPLPIDAEPEEGQPILFKPAGSPLPKPLFLASDADYVDYLTELMGGLAVPAFLKPQRMGKHYLLLGFELDNDTERMMLTDLLYGAAGGTAVIKAPTRKARNFCARLGLEIMEADLRAALSPETETA